MPDINDVEIFMGESIKGGYGLSVAIDSHDVWHSVSLDTEEYARDLADTVWERAKTYCSDRELSKSYSLADYLDEKLSDCLALDINDYIYDVGQTKLF